MSAVAPILAFQTLDCHSKLRIHYRLPVPVTLALLEGFAGCELTVNAFSRFVAGAKDHFTLSRPAMRACGVVGEEKVVVTYAKATATSAAEERASFEQRLGLALGAPLEYRAARTEVV